MVRARLEHEAGLTVNRLSWLVASQSFLFTAYAITLNGVAAGPGGAMTGRQAMLCRLIPLIGVATTGLIYTGLPALEPPPGCAGRCARGSPTRRSWDCRRSRRR